MDCGRLGSEIAPSGPLRVPLVMKAPRMASHSRYEKTDVQRVQVVYGQGTGHRKRQGRGLVDRIWRPRLRCQESSSTIGLTAIRGSYAPASPDDWGVKPC